MLIGATNLEVPAGKRRRLHCEVATGMRTGRLEAHAYLAGPTAKESVRAGCPASSLMLATVIDAAPGSMCTRSGGLDGRCRSADTGLLVAQTDIGGDMSTLALDAPLVKLLPDGVGVHCDAAALFALAGELQSAYRDASPYAHVVLRGLVGDEVLQKVIEELLQTPDRPMRVTESRRMVKHETPQVQSVGRTVGALSGALDSVDFVAFLSQLTGIQDLLADSTHFAAGIHETRPGGFTKVHTDFKRHPHSRLHHRVNVLLYLNPAWLPEYGGSLELWPMNMSAVGRSVLPELGTMVVFETNAHTPHGLPVPVTCPSGGARRSLAAYYYSADRPRQERVGGALSGYRARPGEGRMVGLPTPREFLMALVPERVRRLRDVHR